MVLTKNTIKFQDGSPFFKTGISLWSLKILFWHVYSIIMVNLYMQSDLFFLYCQVDVKNPDVAAEESKDEGTKSS